MNENPPVDSQNTTSFQRQRTEELSSESDARKEKSFIYINELCLVEESFSYH